ncbi:MAG TPA: autotransporter outer membrane beta-barrel domain-containing protein [Anaeromyxobacteraceae bacterium]|jgi:hypothetical protein
MRRLCAACLLLAGPGAGRAQTMLDQEQRLIEIHSLLVTLPALTAPGSLRPGEASLGLEVVAIPEIDGTTGGKRQITASDRTRAFPRPRLALGLPAPGGLRGWVGAAYIPPVRIREVSSHLGAAEGGLAWAPGRWAAGIRAQVLYARSQSPVTDPRTRDTLRTFALGADASAGYRLDLALGSVTPYAGVGLTRVHGDFRVTSDGYLLSSRTTNLGFGAGVRLLALQRLEAAAEVVLFPGRLIHPSFRIAWVPDLGVWR